MKIAIAGTGYVGLSNAILLSQNNEVVALDIIDEKVKMINEKISPIVDKEITEYLKTKELNLVATLDKKKAFQVVICSMFRKGAGCADMYCCCASFVCVCLKVNRAEK